MEDLKDKAQNWNEDQITVVLYEYCRNPFGQFSSTKQFVKDLGNMLGRSPAAIVRKVGNLASFDPQMKERGVEGLAHTSKLDEVVWNKYYGHWDQLSYAAETIIAKLQKKSLEDSLDIDTTSFPAGVERLRLIKQRINQSFFRKTVICSYNQMCCITGLNNPSLLEASHIVGWKQSEADRTNPQNGLCLNALLHKAYDENLLGISPDYIIHISDDFFGEKRNHVKESVIKYYMSFDGKKILLPSRFLPSKELLAAHFDNYIKRNNKNA